MVYILSSSYDYLMILLGALKMTVMRNAGHEIDRPILQGIAGREIAGQKCTIAYSSEAANA